MPSGGPRVPAKPAAVSGPGALSQRTDGGPSGRTQPIRVPSGGAYGERQASEQQQAAAPMAAGGPGGVPAAGQSGPVAPPQGVFGPTERPAESNTAGAQPMTDPVMDNADAALRVLYSKFPHPNIEAMLNKRLNPR